MVKGITPSGIEFELDENKFNDYRVIEALADLHESDALAIVKLERLILGKDLKNRIFKKIETEDGRIPLDAFEMELTAILNAMGDAEKKS